MSQNAFQHSGGNAGRQTRYAPLWTAEYFTGLYSNRSVFHDGSSRIEGLYLGPRGDALTSESLNVEVSSRLTLIRRPGLSVWNSQTWNAPDAFYEFRRFLTTEVSTVLVDQADALYDGSDNQKNLIWTKQAGAGQSYMQSVGNTLYWGDGVSQEKWIAPKGWQASTNILPGTIINQGAEPGTLFIALGGLTLPIIAVQVGATHTTLYIDPASVTEQFSDLDGVEVTFSGLTHAAFLNGATVPIEVISSTLGIIQVFHISGGSTPVIAETGSGTTGNGITGGTIPAFNSTRLAVTADAGQQWKSYGGGVQNWGITAPTVAPTLTPQNGARWWSPNATLSLYYAVLDTNGNVEVTFNFTTGASDFQTGRTYPAWAGLFLTTIDGTTIWTNIGQPGTWQGSAVNGGLGSPLTSQVILDSNQNWQYLSSGINANSGATEPTWMTTVGAATTDGGLVWRCLGPGVIFTTATVGYAYSYHGVDGTVSEASPEYFIIGPIVGTSNAAFSPNVAVLEVAGPAPTDLQVDQIWIWRTQQGGSVLFYEDSIPVDGLSGTFSYLEDGIPDTSNTGSGSLNIFIEAPVDGSSDPPPAGLINLTYHLGRIFGSVDNVLYWSSGPDITTGNGNTGFNPENVAVFPSPIYRMVALSTGMFVFTNSDIYIVYGLGTANSPLTPLPYALGVGLGSYNALDYTGGVIYFFTTDGQIVSLDPNNGLTEVGFPVGDILQSPPWSSQTSYLAWFVGGTRDKALFVSDGIDSWYRMSATPAPETGITWSPKATIASGIKAIASIETSPGTHQLLVGPAGEGPILRRDWDTNADNENAYPAYFTIGSLVLAHPGQVAELGFLTIDSIKVGKPIIPSVRVDEIAGPFEQMPRHSPDPDQLVSSRTLFSHRHYFAQTNQPAICRHIQIQCRWEVENLPNEILSSTLFGGYSQIR